MLVGTLKVDVYIPGAASLKDKRQVVKGVIQRVQNASHPDTLGLPATPVHVGWKSSTSSVNCSSS